MPGLNQELYDLLEPVANKVNSFKYGLQLEPYQVSSELSNLYCILGSGFAPGSSQNARRSFTLGNDREHGTEKRMLGSKCYGEM
jgi:hypothetical protein